MLTATSKSNNLADFLTTKESKTDRPYPKANIGVITGEINIAPMTTALEFIFNPIEAIKIAHKFNMERKGFYMHHCPFHNKYRNRESPCDLPDYFYAS